MIPLHVVFYLGDAPKIQGLFQKFCITDPIHLKKNQQMDIKTKKLYSPGYNLLFNIIVIPTEAVFVLIDEFVDACGIPHQVLFFEKIVVGPKVITHYAPPEQFFAVFPENTDFLKKLFDMEIFRIKFVIKGLY